MTHAGSAGDRLKMHNCELSPIGRRGEDRRALWGAFGVSEVTHLIVLARVGVETREVFQPHLRLSPPWRSACAASCCDRGGGTGTGPPASLVPDSRG